MFASSDGSFKILGNAGSHRVTAVAHPGPNGTYLLEGTVDDTSYRQEIRPLPR